VEPLRQEPEAPFQNATSRDWQKAFNPQRELGAFCSGVNSLKILFSLIIMEENSKFVRELQLLDRKDIDKLF
jgi:hypothetical protein